MKRFRIYIHPVDDLGRNEPAIIERTCGFRILWGISGALESAGGVPSVTRLGKAIGDWLEKNGHDNE